MRLILSALMFLTSICLSARVIADTTVFDNVNVLPMDREVVLENQRVVIQEDLIKEIGPVNSIGIPEGAKKIDATGKYLMPGLADMHTHLDLNGKPDSLWHYIAYGVTSIRNLNGIAPHFQWRDQVKRGELEGPTIYTSGEAIVGLPPDYSWVPYVYRISMTMGPFAAILLLWLLIRITAKYFPIFKRALNRKKIFLSLAIGAGAIGFAFSLSTLMTQLAHIFIVPYATIPESAEDAKRIVREQYAAKADFIKPYNYLPKEHYFAALSEAKNLGLYVAGHTTATPEQIAIQDWIKAGQNEVVHADELTHYFWKGYNPNVNAWVEYDIDMSRIDETARLLAKNNIALTPTLITDDIALLGLENLSGLLAQPEYRGIHQDLINDWRTHGRFVNWRGQEKYRREVWRPFLLAMTKAMSDHGALINVGTDVSVEGVVPGYAVHQELERLVEAGLTPFQALSAGTRNASKTIERMGRKGNFGTIAPEQRADLILLNANPLDDITQTNNQVGVMVRGKWYEKAELERQVANHLFLYKL